MAMMGFPIESIIRANHLEGKADMAACCKQNDRLNSCVNPAVTLAEGSDSGFPADLGVECL